AHAEAARRGRGREDGALDGDLRRDRRPRARAGRPPCGDRGVRSDGRRPRAPRARAQACGDAVRVPVADPPQPARARTGGPRAHGAVRAREVQHPRDRRFDETARDLVARLRPRGPAAYGGADVRYAVRRALVIGTLITIGALLALFASTGIRARVLDA